MLKLEFGNAMSDASYQSETAELVQACLEGDERAKHALVERFEIPVLRFCLSILGHRQDAEDVVQESLIRMLRSLRHWDSTRRFEPWLMTIAANRCRTLMARRAKRGPCWPLQDDERDPQPSFEESLGWREEITLGLSLLRPEYRMALVLFHSQEMSYAEISESLERPIGTIRIWIHRARRELWNWMIERKTLEPTAHAV